MIYEGEEKKYNFLKYSGVRKGRFKTVQEFAKTV